MRRTAIALCLFGVLAGSSSAQNSSVPPIRVAAGTVLDFHLQTRLKAASGDVLDGLAEGTVIRVKVLDSIDSRRERDGSEFRGLVTEPVLLGNQVVVHPDAGVHGLLALLRSRNHPEGFRYELLVTGITEGGRPYALTASLSQSLFESSARTATPTAVASSVATRSSNDAAPTMTRANSVTSTQAAAKLQ
jgi:hypothetical protein